jgi:hypothetical protein
MDFSKLHQRLIAHVRARVHSGELTERGLARITGVSQPHVHNVLKGARALSMQTADTIMRELRVDLLELIEAGELHDAHRRGRDGPE